MHSTEPMPAGHYPDYTAQNQYAPGSPDTFYGQVNVQSPTTTNSASDSANTPSSSAPKSRKTVARPSQSQSTHSNQRSTLNSLEFSTSFRGPSTQVRKERERQLANTPREALIQLAIRREYEAKKAKQLLTTAVLQLEVVKEHLSREEEARHALEEEKHMHGVKTTEAVLKAQMDSMNIQQEIGTYKLQVENLQRDLQRAKEVVRGVEDERDEAERALIRARTNAREMKEKNVLLIAREEGRREGFDEGLRQGRLALATTEPPLIGNGTASAGESTPKARKESSEKPRRRHKSSNATTPTHAPPTAASLEAEAAQAKLREIDEREKLRVKMQLHSLEKDLDRERQRSKEAERAAQRLVEERRKIEEEKKRLEGERERERRARKEAEREKEDIRRREEERRALDHERHQMYEAKERELAELKREKERLEREKADAVGLARKEVDIERERTKRLEEDREREREWEREREEREREREKEKEHETQATIAAATAAAITAAVGAAKSSGSSHRHGSSTMSSPNPDDAQKMPYLPMPPPPMVPGPGMPVPVVMPNGPYSGVPRAASSGSQRAYGRDGRRMSLGSASSSLASGLPLDMLQFPTGRDRDDLSVIMEDTSMRGASPARPLSRAGDNMPPPVWMTNPPPDVTRGQGGGVEGWRSGVSTGYGGQGPIAMPRAPGDGPGPQPPVQMPRAPGDGPGYTAPVTMPLAPGETPAGYQPPSAPISMPLAPGEAPSTYQPPGASGGGGPITMPLAPGETPAGYRPPNGASSAPGGPVTMPLAPGEAPATYQPPGIPGGDGPITMPLAPGETPGGYRPPVGPSTTPGGPITMPLAPGETSGGYRPPGTSTTPGGAVAMPLAPGETPAIYRPPVTTPGGGGPVTMPLAPGETPASYQPPPVEMPRAPGERSPYRPPVGMPAAQSSPYRPPVGMPRVPGESSPYQPSVGMPRAPGERSPYRPSIAMPRAPTDGTPRQRAVTMPRAPTDRSRSPYQAPIAMPRAPSDGPGYMPHSPNALPNAMPNAPGDGPGYVPPGYIPPAGTPRVPSAMGHRNGSAGGYVPNNNLLTPHGSNRNGPIRRPSNGSTSSYEILIEPPSRPPSSLMDEHQDRDINSYLSPNHRPVALPQVQQQVQPMPPRSRGLQRMDTELNSPETSTYALPSNFIPQTLTDRHGVSTPISHPPVLPGMGPVIPGTPVISRPPSAQGPYGNPLTKKGRDNDTPPASRSPFIPPAVFTTSSPTMGSGGWGSRAGSLTGGPSLTPNSTTRDLPGQRSGVPIYGPPGGVGGFSSPNVRPGPMPMPTTAPFFNNPEDDDDGFDSTTLQNTLLNTNPAPVTVVPKKKKKGRK